ncbi:hypothetical protein OROGR_016189 [Orobanche gracilis]
MEKLRVQNPTHRFQFKKMVSLHQQPPFSHTIYTEGEMHVPVYISLHKLSRRLKREHQSRKMVDDSSETIQSIFPMETCHIQVSDESFNLFHAMDRELYTRLIHNLGRDPAESVQVMAFWMWLERESRDMNFIKRILSLPLALLNDVVDETVICLRCVEDDRFLFFGEGGGEIITFLPEILGSRIPVSLRLFHENRIAVLRAVTKIINTVCARAFGDILRRAWLANAVAAADGGPDGVVPSERRVEGVGGGHRMAPSPVLYHSHLNMPFVQLPPPSALNVLPPPAHLLAAAAGNFPAYDFVAQSQMLATELSKNLSINNNRSEEITKGEEEIEVPADDRTVFLTFSKGYPITKDEVREFFTRRFGDFIEDLIMQEVGEDEQVLYARMVARSEAVIEGIVRGNKAKYIINGKHVWARKYVKKQHQLQLQSTGGGDVPSSSSSP